MADYALPKAVDFKNMSQKAKAAVNWSQGWIQRKYDGCAVIIRVLPDGTKTAISATGKPHVSIDHVLARLRPLDKPYTLCGEAILPGRPFAESSGAFRRHSVQAGLFVQLFDGAVDGEEQRPYKERKGLLYHLAAIEVESRDSGSSPFGVVASQYCEGPENAQKWGMTYADDKPTSLNRFFCDGAIWRDPEAPFEIGRSKGSIIKIKPPHGVRLAGGGYRGRQGQVRGQDRRAGVQVQGRQAGQGCYRHDRRGACSGTFRLHRRHCVRRCYG